MSKIKFAMLRCCDSLATLRICHKKPSGFSLKGVRIQVYECRRDDVKRALTFSMLLATSSVRNGPLRHMQVAKAQGSLLTGSQSEVGIHCLLQSTYKVD